MNKAGKIIAIEPPLATPGGEIIISCEGFKFDSQDESHGCFFDDQPAHIISASPERLVVVVPENLERIDVQISLVSGNDASESFSISVGRKLADDLHIVANPAIDPKDDSIILTRSGLRGQHLPVTLFRLDKQGYLDEMLANVMNPTGIAFNSHDELFVTNRADGEVVRISGDAEAYTFAANLGTATGIVFDEDDKMYVGDRSGIIYQVGELGDATNFASIEPSVAAFHLAFGADKKLYVTSPGLASFDAVYAVDDDGYDEIFFRGLGRPQGLAFDTDGNLYVAACMKGRRGIIKIDSNGENAELFVAGANLVGLCFTRQGEMIVASNEAVYNLPLGIYGTLLK